MRPNHSAYGIFNLIRYLGAVVAGRQITAHSRQPRPWPSPHSWWRSPCSRRGSCSRPCACPCHPRGCSYSKFAFGRRTTFPRGWQWAWRTLGAGACHRKYHARECKLHFRSPGVRLLLRLSRGVDAANSENWRNFTWICRNRNSTIWKLQNYFVTQILCEIKVGKSRDAKSAILTHLEYLKAVILIKIAKSLYHVTRFLQNRTTNFDKWYLKR